MDKDIVCQQVLLQSFHRNLVAFGYEPILKDFQKKVAQVAFCVP